MNGAGNENMFVMLNVFAVVFLLLYFVVIRPRRKKERELEQQRNDLKIGDIVTTIGGIVGIVVSVKEDGLTIETGSDKNKIRIKKWAIRDIEKVESSGIEPEKSEKIEIKKSNSKSVAVSQKSKAGV